MNKDFAPRCVMTFVGLPHSNPSNPNVYVRHVTEMIESRDTKEYGDLKIITIVILIKLLLNLHFCY